MKVNTKVRYGLRAILQIAENYGGEPVPISNIYLSSLQGGAFQTDGLNIVLAKVVNFNPGSALIANNLQGRIVVCGNCDPADTSTSCVPGIMSDVPTDSDNPLYTDTALEEQARAFGPCLAKAIPNSSQR